MGELSPVERKFILHWGEMGTRWGVSRTVAQIHALLFISATPLAAEEIAGTLSVARSNVSTSLRDLQSWGIVRVVHELGDRRDHFESLKDVWEMFQTIVEERKAREIDPTLSTLRECLKEVVDSETETPLLQERLSGLLDFFETLNACYKEASRLPASSLAKYIKVSNKVHELLDVLPPRRG
jgi:DNA-binding transcriptional regulator GbsR (MarR family)